MKRYKFSTYPTDEFYERGEVDAEIAELVEMLEKINGTAMGFWRGNSVFSEIQELINKHKVN